MVKVVALMIKRNGLLSLMIIMLNQNMFIFQNAKSLLPIAAIKLNIEM